MYEEMIEYVRKYFEQNNVPTTDMQVKYPFRSRFDHSLRVYAWAMRLVGVEPGDREIVAVSAIFHDIGKAVKSETPHAETGALLCGEYLEKIGYPEEKKLKIMETIRLHSSKHSDANQLTHEQKILMDADLLDEVGATAVLWDCMAVALDESPSYLKAYNKFIGIYGRLCTHWQLLKTGFGRQLFEERLGFLKKFIDETKYELGL